MLVILKSILVLFTWRKCLAIIPNSMFYCPCSWYAVAEKFQVPLVSQFWYIVGLGIGLTLS
ncbi:hypothetical protein KC19_3G242600 [Ceratodon purpureus]|uniref:Uncharacterized protein n=1 Tax=Ceratodon purpureus TaxID=3225 RepID=A0A8T0IPF3_CERPU|nr:hypothetical protein KC19_3G242600 [Ceratodon purpureus]